MVAPLIIAGAIELAKAFAPDLVQSLTGSEKAGEIAGRVVGIAQSVTGTGSPDAALAVLKADPAKVLEFQQHMADLEVELERMRYADIANARHLQETALNQDDLFSKRFIYWFAAAWSLFTMFYVTLVTFYTPNTPEGKSIAQTVLGFLLGTAVASIFMYFFGSTRTSDSKNRLLAASRPPT